MRSCNTAEVSCSTSRVVDAAVFTVAWSSPPFSSESSSRRLALPPFSSSAPTHSDGFLLLPGGVDESLRMKGRLTGGFKQWFNTLSSVIRENHNKK